jgi:hypothetical protein
MDTAGYDQNWSHGPGHSTLTLQVKHLTKRAFEFKFVMLIYELLEDRRAGFSLILK